MVGEAQSVAFYIHASIRVLKGKLVLIIIMIMISQHGVPRIYILSKHIGIYRLFQVVNYL
jgi:hypothetical protein